MGSAAGFEDDDGNLAPDASGLNFDWNSFAPVTWTGDAPYREAQKDASGWQFRGIEDDGDSTADSAFAGGTKQDDSCPTVIQAKAPNKDDLKRIYVASKVGADGHIYLELAWVRIPQNTTSSSAHVGFEFNQGTAGACGGASDGLVKRVPGDMLIVYDFEGGSATPVLTLRRWITSGTCEVASDSPPCWGVATNLTATGIAEGAVNVGGTVTDGIAPNAPETLGDSEFGEAGLDLTGAGVFGEGTCTNFGTVFGVSRSSGNSGTAQMKDLVGPGNFSLSNCSATLTTTPSPGAGQEVAPGTSVTDFATVQGSSNTGTPPTPTGDVTFYLCGPTATDSTDLCTTGGTEISTNALSGSGDTATATSDAVNTAQNPLGAGRYCFRAEWPGDDNYSGSSHSGTDNSECFIVQKVSPTVVTQASAGLALGGSISDTATLSGGVNPTGSITFTLYGPDDATCSSPAIFTSTVTVSGNGDYVSDSFTPSAAGTYRWIANYSGDANNNETTNGCNEANESVVVGKASPTVTTNAGDDVTLGENGNDLTDSATLSGGTSDISGTIEFHLYSDDQCQNEVSGSPVSTTVDSGNGTYTSPAVHVDAAGTYYWVANYLGDSNNNATANGCNLPDESVTVISPAISIEKTPDSQMVVSGGTASFTITVENTGDVTLTDVHVTDAQAPGCARTAAEIEADRGSSTFAPGDTYGYDCTLADVTSSFTNSATATGSPPFGPDVSDTDTADVTVIHPAISIAKDPNSQTIDPGGTASFTITVENTGDVTLTDVHVTDALAPGCARTAEEIAADPNAPNSGTATFDPGDTYSYTCSLANVLSAFTNVASATGTPPVGPDVTASDTANVGLNPPPPPPPGKIIDLAITKSDDPDPVTLGGNLTYTVTVTNNGPDTATVVHVADQLPPTTTFVSASSSQGTCSESGGVITCDLGTVAAGATVTITVVVTPTATGTIVNTAIVTGNEPESNTANNQATEPTLVQGPLTPPAVCSSLKVTPRQLVASGKRTVIVARVRLSNGKPYVHARVRVRAPGINVVKRTGGKGIARIAVRPKKPGIARITVIGSSRCSARSGIVGVFQPPLTG